MIEKSNSWVTRKIEKSDSIDFFQFSFISFLDDIEVVDDDSISSDEHSFLVSIRSSTLPLRNDNKFWREPYYP
ncbi:hypothetical protein PJP10_32205, partial [Mycobacterium kansasii]